MKKTITYKEIKDKVLDIINNGGGGGGCSLKTFTFSGSGEADAELNLNLPTECALILAISGMGEIEGQDFAITTGVLPSKGVLHANVVIYENGEMSDGMEINALYSIENGILHSESLDDGNPLAYPIEFTVYYL